MRARPDSSTQSPNAPELVQLPSAQVSRRTVLKVGGIGAMAATVTTVGAAAWRPQRASAATRARAATSATSFPDIQFDIGAFVHPAQTVAGVLVDFGVLYTFMAPAALTRNPTKRDQAVLASALATVESSYAFSPSGIFAFVAYGLPYFNRLPQSLVASAMPRLAFDHSRFALEEAVPAPTDVSPLNPGITKRLYNVPVQIEGNDVLITLRSDSLKNITEVAAWFNGSNILNGKFVASPAFKGLFNFKTPRLNFVQPGLPRKIATANNFSFTKQINPASSMWMGFVDQQVSGSAPHGATVTFAGTSSAVLTTAKAGDYFDNGAIQHLSHVIDDLEQFYSVDGTDSDEPETYGERVQYMFRSKTPSGAPGLPFPQDPDDPFTNGGGLGAPTGNLAAQQPSAFLPNQFNGPNDQATNFDPSVTDHQKYRVGHLAGLQRSARAADGTPLHIRNDGPGLSSQDVPDGSAQPTLEFTVFVPTAEFFRVMRINSASLDYVKAGDQGGTAASVPPGAEAADSSDDGLERFTQATRRQNFLVPPRRHRSFPLLEET
ncbi:MAG TPA: hypothetical protein VFQ44_27955 [Streptosporangiaceae bacterium]|nr:hypothetical protein [Streptosporangiaceae bacterium]